MHPDAYVVDLGVNDTAEPGTATGPGYADYGAKIDWLLQVLGPVPVYWSNLPCRIEPAARLAGCTVVDAALTGATARHHNLIVIDWARVADTHRDYLGATTHGFGNVHLTDPGAKAWAGLVARTLDARFAPA